MPVRRTITVSITPEQDASLHACFASGRFHSVSEIMRAGLRLLEGQEVAHLHHMREGGPTASPHAGRVRRKA